MDLAPREGNGCCKPAGVHYKAGWVTANAGPAPGIAFGTEEHSRPCKPNPTRRPASTGNSRSKAHHFLYDAKEIPLDYGLSASHLNLHLGDQPEPAIPGVWARTGQAVLRLHSACGASASKEAAAAALQQHAGAGAAAPAGALAGAPAAVQHPRPLTRASSALKGTSAPPCTAVHAQGHGRKGGPKVKPGKEGPRRPFRQETDGSRRSHAEAARQGKAAGLPQGRSLICWLSHAPAAE